MPRLAALGVAVLAFVSMASAAPKVVLKATLTGAYLHAGGGSGTATITIAGKQVCWKFTYKGIDKPMDSGIHIVPPPAAGKHSRSILPFTASTSTAPGCVAGRAAWISKILANPGGFYVHITTARYPNGAIGGKLHRS
jgi:hypothetical protein